MKKNRLFFIAATLLVGVAMFVSCQKAEEVADQELVLKVAPMNVTGELNYNDPALVGVPHQFCLVFPQDYKQGNKNQDPAPNKTNAQVQLFLGDNPLTEGIVETDYWLQIGHVPGGTDIGFCFDYTFTTVGVYALKYQVGSSKTETSITVINACVDSFTGEAKSCGTEREANFTFTSDGTSAVKIQGGLTNFTGANAVVTVPEGYTATQKTPGGSSNRVITVEGPASCSPVVINVKWTSTNSDEVITGDWSASDDEGRIGEEVPGLSCD